MYRVAFMAFHQHVFTSSSTENNSKTNEWKHKTKAMAAVAGEVSTLTHGIWTHTNVFFEVPDIGHFATQYSTFTLDTIKPKQSHKKSNRTQKSAGQYSEFDSCKTVNKWICSHWCNVCVYCCYTGLEIWSHRAESKVLLQPASLVASTFHTLLAILAIILYSKQYMYLRAQPYN